MDIENTVHNNRDSENGKKNKKNRNDNGDRKNKIVGKKKENNLDFNSTKNQKEREMDDYVEIDNVDNIDHDIMHVYNIDDVYNVDEKRN